MRLSRNRTMEPQPAPETKSDVITTAAASIDNSRWSNRIVMLFVAMAALLILLGLAIMLNKGVQSINAVERLLVVVLVLAVVTPSAEQLSKMLAQVAAIRFGVGKAKEPES